MKYILLAAFFLLNPALSSAKDDRTFSVTVQPFEVSAPKAQEAFSDFLRREAGPQPDEPAALNALGKKIAKLLSDKLAENKEVSLDEKGAIVITGKAFPLNNDFFIAVKIAHPKSNKVFAAKQSGPLKNELNQWVNALAADILKLLEAHQKELSGTDPPR